MPSGLVHDTSSSSSSVKSGKSGKSGKSSSKPPSGTFSQYNSNASITTVNTNNGSDNTSYYGHKMRSGSISSGFPGGPPSPTQQFHNNSHSIANGNGYASRPGLMGSLAEDQVYHHHVQHQQADVPSPSPSGDYTQCLQWLQQTCRPVHMKELEQPSNVPVPLTAANAKHPSQIGGIQHVQIANWKQSQVQLLPIDRWGQPQDVLAEIQALHRLRKCRQIIQLYGYLPNAMMPSGQMPALLLQQPSYGSLRQFLDHHFESIHWPERYKLALDMAQGLRYLTVQGIPCTLHSGNILVDAEGVAVLTGFGSATGMVASAPCQMAAQPSPSALLVYMAPERLSGKGPHSPDWEVFSLGILLWELSSGRIPFDEIIARAEAGPRLGKNMEQLSSAIVKGLREETIPGTPDIFEQLFKMCWDSDAEARPPLEVVEETLQMLVVVEPMDMLMLPGEELSMPVSTILSDSIDGDSFGSQTATRCNSIRSVSPGSNQTRNGHVRPTTLHQAISVSNADMTEWFILSGHDLNGYAIVPTYSLECEITPIQTCLGHFLPSSLPILKELMEQDVDTKLLVKRSLQNCLHVLLDRYIPFRNENGSAHLFAALDMLLAANINLNAQDVQGYTPLHLLMRNPKISSEDVAEVLKRMVLKGADTSIQAPRDGNVLALAAKYLHFEAAKYLLAQDPTASDPESIDKAIESCMTMTGRQTDKFVNLRTKLRELLKLWTGQAAAARREKVVLKTLQDAGQMDSSGMRLKTKLVHLAPQAQLDYANKYYDSHIKKQREKLFANIGMLPGMAR
ncbi:hypothetical protein BGZ70_007038 [Mortierella alpina]|uniref:Protein kinase domain-containing protein n=1 Tax=Mortierella alpina TaxID=64518 RepID=A0A9P6JAE0_MORAP|nr:hypothetical protein BGZ70_007038 [Mortierella alpina]